MPSKRTPASNIALGGVLASLAVLIMSMGTLIPVATYVCPMLCALILQLVLKICGSRIAWAWYGAVTLLSLLMAPDKEAAAVFLALGYYPIVKDRLERLKKPVAWTLKLVIFNATLIAGTLVTFYLFAGDTAGKTILDAFAFVFGVEELGALITAGVLVLANVTFVVYDIALTRLIIFYFVKIRKKFKFLK